MTTFGDSVADGSSFFASPDELRETRPIARGALPPRTHQFL
ncbi:MAG: hypothetical protein AB8G26_19740 [Ilumatobacter sp.]